MRRMFRNALVALFTVLTGYVCVAQPAPLAGDALDRMLLIDKKPSQGSAENAVQSAELRLRMNQIETQSRRASSRAALGAFALVLFLHGAFCALWAQGTNRNAWGWFVLGMCFHLFAVLAVLYLNSQTRAAPAHT